MPCALLAILLASLTVKAQDSTSTHTSEPESGDESTSIGGYGDIHYTEPEGPAKGTVDVLTFVMFLEHQFSPDLSFFSELEVEHTKIEGGEGGEVAVEQAYIQYNFNERLNLRAGLLLLPIGSMNEFHEPPAFNGVRRPRFQKAMIPTTWREIGFGFVGRIPEVEGLQYRTYLTSGLDAAGFDGDQGIYEGHFEGAEAPMTSLAVSGRVEYLNTGLRTGGWLYYGGSAANHEGIGSGLFDSPVFMYGIDAQYSIANLFLRGELMGASIKDAAKLAEAFQRTKPEFNDAGDLAGYTWNNPIGSTMGGGYIEAAYDVMKLIRPNSSKQLLPFVRFEKFNTQSTIPVNITPNPEDDRTFIIVGLTFKPTFNTVFKTDWTFAQDGTKEKIPGEFALGIGYNF
ncbi:MAG: hypothetical protein ABIQ57_05125 [Candidatus Kapaibacterium sp.]